MAIDLTLDDDQLLLQRSANELFRKRYPSDVVRAIEDGDLGYSPEGWQELAEPGLVGHQLPRAVRRGWRRLPRPLPHLRGDGTVLVPSPHLDTVAVAGEIVLATGTEDQRRTFLPEIADGNCIISPAIIEGDGSFGVDAITCSAERRGGEFVIRGTKLLVPYARSADRFLCAVRTADAMGVDDISLLLVDAQANGITCDEIPNIAGHTLYAVTFDDVSTPAEHLVGEEGRGWGPLSEATLKAAVLQTATIVGAARAVLDMTNQYAKDREQFGGPIGRYQAVQYLVTDILIDMHRADLLAKQAAFRIDAGKAFEREAALAVAFGKRAAAHLHRQAHEVHAGVAFILEHDLSLYSRRSKFWENHLGDARHYQERVADSMLT